MAIFGRKTTACPFCYQELDVKKVAFRCGGRGAPGRPPCTAAPDPKRVEYFDDSKPDLPVVPGYVGRGPAVCPGCGGETGVRVCPSCHSSLPHSLANDSPLFGLVGVRNSGKTVYLSVLHKELVGAVGDRFDASIANPGGSSGLAVDLARFERSMASESGQLPGQTSESAALKKQPAVYEWKYGRDRKTVSTIFSFYDTAGEEVSDRDKIMQQQYLGQAAGMIVLLDPFGFPANRERGTEVGAIREGVAAPEDALAAVTHMLQSAKQTKRNAKLKVPIAVVVSKLDAFFGSLPDHHPLRRPASNADAFDEDESTEIHDHVGALIERWGGGRLLRMLEQEYETYRLFGVSALGAEPTNYRTPRVNPRGLLPYRVADPILWLLAERGFIPMTAARK